MFRMYQLRAVLINEVFFMKFVMKFLLNNIIMRISVCITCLVPIILFSTNMLNIYKGMAKLRILFANKITFTCAISVSLKHLKFLI